MAMPIRHRCTGSLVVAALLSTAVLLAVEVTPVDADAAAGDGVGDGGDTHGMHDTPPHDQDPHPMDHHDPPEHLDEGDIPPHDLSHHPHDVHPDPPHTPHDTGHHPNPLPPHHNGEEQLDIYGVPLSHHGPDKMGRPPHLAGPHAPEFTKPPTSKHGLDDPHAQHGDDHPLHDVPPHERDNFEGHDGYNAFEMEWMEQGLKHPLRFFDEHGFIEHIHEPGIDLESVEEFQVLTGMGPHEHHHVSHKTGVTCIFHYMSNGLGSHADKHVLDKAESVDIAPPPETEDANTTEEHAEYWRMYLYDYGTHHECTVTTTEDWGHSRLNFTYAHLIVVDLHNEPLKLVSTHVWPKEAASGFVRGHNLLDTEGEDEHGETRFNRTDGGHPEIPFPDGHGLVSKESWSGKLAQLAVHFQPTRRDMSDL
eukprot:m.64241 g.64241  ORF g.64241 m.64241 type:complete len:420 (-) comp8211_c0_seq2:146-1405(-)